MLRNLSSCISAILPGFPLSKAISTSPHLPVQTKVHSPFQTVKRDIFYPLFSLKSDVSLLKSKSSNLCFSKPPGVRKDGLPRKPQFPRLISRYVIIPFLRQILPQPIPDGWYDTGVILLNQELLHLKLLYEPSILLDQLFLNSEAERDELLHSINQHPELRKILETKLHNLPMEVKMLLPKSPEIDRTYVQNTIHKTLPRIIAEEKEKEETDKLGKSIDKREKRDERDERIWFAWLAKQPLDHLSPTQGDNFITVSDGLGNNARYSIAAEPPPADSSSPTPPKLNLSDWAKEPYY